jgi:hypothetical protein
MRRRELLFAAAAVASAPAAAMADESIAGQWQARLPDKVIIAMDVLADGHWTSQTVHDDTVVAEMAGTYTQKKTSARSGTLVFTPVKSKVSKEHGAAQIETDKYTLEKAGTVLRLESGNDVSVFEKQTFAR